MVNTSLLNDYLWASNDDDLLIIEIVKFRCNLEDNGNKALEIISTC